MGKTASKFDLAAGKIIPQVQALDERRALDADPTANDNSVYFGAVGEPTSLVVRKVMPSSHFRRAAHYGPEHEDRKKLERQGHAAFAKGTKTLLMLDNMAHGFSYKKQDVDFSTLGPNNRVWPLERWIAANRGDFKPVVIRSACEAVREINKVREAGRSPSQYCFAYYGGAVVPHSNFYYNWNQQRMRGETYKERREKFGVQQEKLAKLYNALHDGTYGVRVKRDVSKDTELTRAVGLPILIRVHATRSTFKQEGAGGLKCNFYEESPKSRLLVTIKTEPPVLRESAAYESLREGLVARHDYYVLAMPSVSVDPADMLQVDNEGDLIWHNLRLVLNDIERQVTPVGAFKAGMEPG